MIHPPSKYEYYTRSVNLDITNKCKLRCQSCARVLSKGFVKAAQDLRVEDYKKITRAFRCVTLCGQISDPIYHPNFQEILSLSKNLKYINIHTNGTGFSQQWWEKSFETVMNNGKWIFALDGLPNESHKYRVGQDGESVWRMMKLGASLGANIVWQYIPFNYNEDHINQAMDMAADNNISFDLKISSRHPEGMAPNNPRLKIERIKTKMLE